MALTPDEEAEAVRLASYNERPVNPATNPRGIGRGGNSNFIAALKDFAGFGKGVVRVSTDALTQIEMQADRFTAALDVMQTGPVLTVNNQTGHVVVDTSVLEGIVNDRLDAADAKIAALASSAAAYSFAFGG